MPLQAPFHPQLSGAGVDEPGKRAISFFVFLTFYCQVGEFIELGWSQHERVLLLCGSKSFASACCIQKRIA